MNPTKKSILIHRTAHYYQLVPDQKPDAILFVIHGYAQLAEDFIKTFEALGKYNVAVIAPEGLSKFYNKQRKPVASWMTSHERLDEIKDYIHYLNDLSALILTSYPDAKLALLGFSQGVSTAMRWLARSTIRFDSFFACSGSIPPELTKEEFSHMIDLNYHYYYGDQDKLMTETHFELAIEKLNELDIAIKLKRFEGIHEIPDSCIQDLIALSQVD